MDQSLRPEEVESRFRRAVTALHAEKSAAYGPAWKRRGEQISILANIARKVDRAEQFAKGAPVTRDESAIDTAVDLFVYCLKYETFLADIDAEVSRALFGGSRVRPPFSDGVDAFEHLLRGTDLSGLELPVGTLPAAVDEVMERFAELEACFVSASLPPASKRLAIAQQLTRASIDLVGSLGRKTPATYLAFLSGYKG